VQGVALTAKYPATCASCSRTIAPGEQIEKDGGRWVHLACAATGQTGLPVGTATPARTTTATGIPAKKRAAPKPAMAEHQGATEVWTDGACSGNPGPGGWAWATRDGRRGSGGSPATTNQRMEIQAAFEAVKALPGPLTVVSDSTYVVNCFRDAWWKGWLARGWVNSQKKPVANRDLWEPFVELVRERDEIAFRWVKGHSGDEMNDLVDALAVEAGRAAVGA
jgi:ribonuclease HI